MLPPGDRPDELPEQRIRPAPRPVRPALTDPSPPPPGPVPEPLPPPPSLFPEETATFRPDRTRMDPTSLDRSTARKMSGGLVGGRKVLTGSRRSRLVYRWAVRGITLIIVLGIAGGLVWSLRGRLRREASHVFQEPAKRVTVPSPSDRVLDMLEAFLTAPDMETKARHVLDGARVQPLMEAAYATGRLPEDRLRFHVPQPLEAGIFAVPAKVNGPSPFLLHLMVREEAGEPKLDWETYEQEMSRTFVNFVAKPGRQVGEFRLVLERTHDFVPSSADTVAVRVAAPGSPALADPVLVRPEIAPALTDALTWNRRRRALVRLQWESPPDSGPPRLVLREVLRWEFLP